MSPYSYTSREFRKLKNVVEMPCKFLKISLTQLEILDFQNFSFFFFFLPSFLLGRKKLQ